MKREIRTTMESLVTISAQCLVENTKYWQDWETSRGHLSVLLYKSISGPHLESCRQFWSLHFIKNIVEWKEAPEKATRLIKSLVFIGGIS